MADHRKVAVAKSTGSLTIFAAIRRASSLVSSFALVAAPGSCKLSHRVLTAFNIL
jgi:predicted alpha/beta hydrolase family esterase